MTPKRQVLDMYNDQTNGKVHVYFCFFSYTKRALLSVGGRSNLCVASC